ncbi:hypothetical protein I546_0399 [Mycobacterium kansasii 732]|nr:hypothetical protein I546_0399 [Mycobacterium kansasii 732]
MSVAENKPIVDAHRRRLTGTRSHRDPPERKCGKRCAYIRAQSG